MIELQRTARGYYAPFSPPPLSSPVSNPRRRPAPEGTPSRSQRRRWRREASNARYEQLRNWPPLPTPYELSTKRPLFPSGSFDVSGLPHEVSETCLPFPGREHGFSGTSRGRGFSRTIGAIRLTQAQSAINPATSPTPSSTVLSTIEKVWELERNPNSFQSRAPPFTALPHPSRLGDLAEHASLMLDVFNRVKPVDDRQLTAVQKGLINTALTSVLTLTQQVRILSVSANEPLGPTPLLHDEALSVYSGCVVCFARVADILLMPCRHLTLCEECCDEIKARVRIEGRVEKMQCPVCRHDVLDSVKIFRV